MSGMAKGALGLLGPGGTCVVIGWEAIDILCSIKNSLHYCSHREKESGWISTDYAEIKFTLNGEPDPVDEGWGKHFTSVVVKDGPETDGLCHDLYYKFKDVKKGWFGVGGISQATFFDKLKDFIINRTVKKEHLRDKIKFTEKFKDQYLEFSERTVWCRYLVVELP
uniref:Uncharacterized protein n=1 Tax=Trieres chinensis TaxID=1514140 RepID=A0A7S2EFW5_TRICV|mmetsp:Transcript_21947/g.44411  ORF Transcript_21947/g.44411 Transcript_21947/m.44411 type:complete len:166 (+) Transcript_21947:138-635(+)